MLEDKNKLFENVTVENHKSEKSESLKTKANVYVESEDPQVKTSPCFNLHLASNGLPLSTAFSESLLTNVDVHDSSSPESPSYEQSQLTTSSREPVDLSCVTPMTPIETQLEKELIHSYEAQCDTLKDGLDDDLIVADDTHNDDDGDNDNCKTKGKFCDSTISEVLGLKIPEKFFTFELECTRFTFDFDKEDWSRLLLNRKGRCFARNSWECYYLEGITKSNPYCVFMFKNHFLSCANLRKKNVNTPIFTANGHCKFANCSCKVSLKMFSESLVHVKYTGHIKHDIHECHERPFTGKEREQAKKRILKWEKTSENVFGKI